MPRLRPQSDRRRRPIQKSPTTLSTERRMERLTVSSGDLKRIRTVSSSSEFADAASARADWYRKRGLAAAADASPSVGLTS